jgi:hypothetical protein
MKLDSLQIQWKPLTVITLRKTQTEIEPIYEVQWKLLNVITNNVINLLM